MSIVMNHSLGQFSGTRIQGFALPAVAFLIVVIALVITAMDRINTSQQATTTLGMQGARAYMMAISGVEWTAFQIRSTNACPTAGTITGLVLHGFQVDLVNCNKVTDAEGSLTIDSYEITVLASYGGTSQLGQTQDFASRELTVSLVIES